MTSITAFKTGSVIYLNLGYGVLVYGRWDDKGAAVVALNNNETGVSVTVPVWKIDIVNDTLSQALLSYQNKNKEAVFTADEKKITVKNGLVELELLPYSSTVLVIK